MKKPLLTRIIIVVFCSIPLRTRRALFRALLLLFYHISARYRFITLHNLTLSFPEKKMSEIVRIAKKAFMNLGTMAAEFFEIPSLAEENGFERLIKVEGAENFRMAVAKNKGILCYASHLGNWEIMAAYFGSRMKRANMVFQALGNTTLEGLVAWERKYTGNTLISKGGATKKILRLLKENEVIGIMLDQNVSRRKGVFVNFFGRPACTTTGFAALALQTGAPVLPAFIVRQEDGTYLFIIKEEAEIIRTGDYERDIFENTKRFTKTIEDMVRRYPDQWLWLHQRWKTKEAR
jgi:KDO2-lipid IV(A) lauroyltransferase